MMDWDTLNNLRTHKDAWVRLLEQHRAGTTSILDDTEADHSYMTHEIEVLKVTLDQAAELVDAVKAAEPLLRLILDDG